MRIRSIQLTWVRVPLVEPFRISSGSVSEKDAIVVRVDSDGFSGWGESSPMAGSFYSTDTPESCWSELCDVIVPAVLRRDIARDVGSPLPAVPPTPSPARPRAVTDSACPESEGLESK